MSSRVSFNDTQSYTVMDKISCSHLGFSPDTSALPSFFVPSPRPLVAGSYPARHAWYSRPALAGAQLSRENPSEPVTRGTTGN